MRRADSMRSIRRSSTSPPVSYVFQSLLVHGGTWTAEAREPNRRQKLHEQLSLARRLRATLEDAANKAENASPEEARALLIQSTPDISILACLTDAVKGNYTLDSYDCHAQHARRRQQDRQEKVDRASAAILDEHLDNMAQEQIEAIEAENVARKPPPLPATATAAVAEKPKPPPKRRQTAKKSKAKKAAGSRAKAPRANITRIPTHALFAKVQSSRAVATAKPAYPEPLEKPPKRAATTKRGRRLAESRQCHDCKSSTTYYRCCQYWLPDGRQCGKFFCARCLEGKYGPPRQDWDSMTDEDWQ